MWSDYESLWDSYLNIDELLEYQREWRTRPGCALCIIKEGRYQEDLYYVV